MSDREATRLSTSAQRVYDDPANEGEAKRRKAARHAHVRSDHRHEYEPIRIDSHSLGRSGGESVPLYHLAKRCRRCGRLSEVRLFCTADELPDGLRTFEVDGLGGLFGMTLPDDREVRP